MNFVKFQTMKRILFLMFIQKGMAYGEQESLRNHRKVYIEEVNNEHR